MTITATADEVRSPYDGQLVGEVTRSDGAMVAEAVATAAECVAAGGFPQHARAEALERAARGVEEHADELTVLVAREVGKPVRSARTEVLRCAETMRLSAIEARRIAPEGVPMEGSAAGAGKLGFVIRVPYGVVGAISPFNFPLNLVAHKLGPALAAGNAVVLKPAEQAPLSGLRLAEILLEAGVPPGWVNVVPGLGEEAGAALVDDERVRAITFTGSAAVGLAIQARVPRKKVSLELGSAAPLIVCEDGDWRAAADAAVRHAFSFAGQACVSVQRILVHRALLPRFRERLVAGVSGLVVGDPLDERTDVGPLISPAARWRVKSWIDEAIAQGGELLVGGELVDEGRCLAPTVIEAPPRTSKVWCEEVFGPLATLHPFDAFDEALALANDTPFGLQAGIFTASIESALVAARALQYGGVLVNEAPTFRADQMPYGGVKDSGNAREGPAYAVRELSEARFVSLQGASTV